MRVNFSGPDLISPFDDRPQPKTIYGTLTTDHAASSYGMPVVIDEAGSVYGPAETGPLNDDRGEGWNHLDLVRAARRAGYTVQSETCPE